MRFPIPDYILKIMRLMKDNNFSPYLVGGCVRDFIMGKAPHDYDITVAVTPDEISSLFEKEGFRTIQKGRQFGTVGVLVENEVVEITPYRIEANYNDSRHPDTVEFVKDITLDLARRDFTINAMAMDTDGNILDIFGGIEDINNKVIRCVGEPDERFCEDALRILRAIRFSSRLGFEIDSNTKISMSKHKGLLKNISSERIQEELKGTLIHSHSYKILSDCKDILCSVIPGFTPSQFLQCDCGDFATRLFSCIYNNCFDVVLNICNYLKLSNLDAKKITSMHTLYSSVLTTNNNKILFDDKTKKALCDYNPEYIKDLFIFSDSDKDMLDEFLKNGVFSKEKLAITGGDIASMELFPKSDTAKTLNSVLYAVSLGEINNTREDIEKYLTSIRN